MAEYGIVLRDKNNQVYFDTRSITWMVVDIFYVYSGEGIKERYYRNISGISTVRTMMQTFSYVKNTGYVPTIGSSVNKTENYVYVRTDSTQSHEDVIVTVIVQ